MLKPIITSIALTNKCNLKCLHCLPDSKMECSEELSTDEIIDVIAQAKELGAMVIAFSGGEIFTRADLFDILNKVEEFNLRFSFTSNGTLIDSFIAKRLAKLKPLVARISLDSNVEKEHDAFRGIVGAYKKTIQGIEHLKENGIPVTAITTVTTKNMAKIEDIIKMLIDLKVNAFNTTSFVPFGRGEKHNELMLSNEQYRKVLVDIKNLKEKYKKNIDIHWHDTLSFLLDEINNEERIYTRSCPAGWSMMEISSDGYVMPCISMNIREENIRNSSLKHIWYDSKLFTSIRNINLTGKCKNCKHIQKCHGGCRAIAYNYYNDLTAPDPMCWIK